MIQNLHMGHAVAGLYLTGALLATVQAPAKRVAPQQPLSSLSAPPLTGPASTADDTRPAPNALTTFLQANPACREVTDGCQVCVRGTGNLAHCSTPGIACAPAGWMCNVPLEASGKSPAKSAK